jgi:hypothetical protein
LISTKSTILKPEKVQIVVSSRNFSKKNEDFGTKKLNKKCGEKGTSEVLQLIFRMQ